MTSPHLLNFPMKPKANPKAIVSGPNYRFTILDAGLIRLEYSPDDHFEDRASTFAINRDLTVPEFRTINQKGFVEIITDRFHLNYDKKPFSPSGLSVQVRGDVTNWHSLWRYGEDANGLGGTARTLDNVDGRCELGGGVVAKNGFASIDDSKTMLFEQDGWVASRKPGERIDLYLFTYGYNYKAAMKAFYAVSGKQPMLPRWAFGNWWSRYYAYTADGYLKLMDKFNSEKIPLSVGVIDMDWHLVDVDPVHGSGWTGYTWNKKLFPDPEGFMKELHDRKLKVTLNVHPADGLRSYEDAYKKVCEVLGREISKGDALAFDLTDRDFLDAYFNVLHRGLEDQGVDFWWVDWQQGEHSRIPGIDPLWCLNHYHFLDNARGGRRPLTFSRYAGPGSHRYPVGFSGDSIITWESLEFQPEFTLTASNIGYGWWSHDVGGHFFGIKDDELAARWVQLGVWSPILRLHSSAGHFNTREPWAFGADARWSMTEALRFRHRLVPYLYTLNANCGEEPVVQPMYWQFPKRDEAYSCRNQFTFGDLLVAPITSPQDKNTRLGRVRAWLPPQGRFVDIFTGTVYDGDREIWLHRRLNGYPVLAKEGTIIPLDGSKEPENGCGNPESLEVVIVVGKDSVFELLEDDGTGTTVGDVKFTRTKITYVQSSGTVKVDKPSAATYEAPKSRKWRFRLPGLQCTKASVKIGGQDTSVKPETSLQGTTLDIGDVPFNSSIEIAFGNDAQLAPMAALERIFDFIFDAQIPYGMKNTIWQKIHDQKTPHVSVLASRMQTIKEEGYLYDHIMELLLADSRSVFGREIKDPIQT